MKRTVLALMLTLPLIASATYGDVLEVSPSQAAVRTNGEGDTEIFLMFDLSGMRQADEFKVSEALLDWTFTSLDDGAVFSVTKVTEDWSVAAVEGDAEIDVEVSPVDDWHLSSLDKQRLGSFVRLEVTEVVSGWVESPSSNHGVLIVTDSISEESAVEQTGSATLTVRYGCCK